ncbi:MAG: hypothetical protein WB998_06350 [Solirubrobacteraceae bacterium]
MSGNLWKDEKRSPGPWPQGNRAPLAMIAVVLALAALSQLHNKTVLAVFVIVIGLGAFYCAVRLNPERHREERYTRGSGWWVGLIMSKLPMGATRVIWVLMGIGICTLGVLALLSK